MIISSVRHEIFKRDWLLYNAGWLNIFLFAIALVFSMLDQRELLGINVWVKPMKFSLSIAIFVWTVAWYLGDVQGRFVRLKKIISYTVFISMVIEIGIIFFQAMRGVRSHFNVSSLFDAFLFQLMGIMIAVTTLMMILLLILLMYQNDELSRDYLISLRLGLIIYLIGSAAGGLMLMNKGHTVGAVDGGEGIIFMNWSRAAGDLRIAHFIGLHGMQLVPLFGFVLKSTIIDSIKSRSRIIIIAFVFYILFLAWTLSTALQGVSLF